MHKITSLHFMRPFSRSAKRTSSLCSRLIETFIYILLLSLPLVSCSADEPESETPVVPDNGEEGIPSSDNVEMITYTHAVPDGYDQEAEERGSVVRIDYDTGTMRKAAARRGRTRHTSICHTAMTEADGITSSISCTGITARRHRPSRTGTAWYASCSTR